MKLIRHTKLRFRSEKSDKVYEVDLCEAGEGEFVVNFRYGRRGTTLREGTKTAFPESRSKAEQIYEELVASKTKKGYQITSQTSELADLPRGREPEPAEVSEPQRGSDLASQDPRVAATMRLLGRAARGEPTDSTWTVSRAIWTAGAWKMTDAAPSIVAVAERSNDEFVLWSSAWALGRIGSRDDADFLSTLVRRLDISESLRRIARLSHYLVVDEKERATLAAKELTKLPGAVAGAIEAEDREAVTTAVLEALEAPATRELGGELYLVALERPWVREAIHDVIDQVTPDDRSMPLLRHVLKAAELTMDAELFGDVVKKFETSPGRGTARYNWRKRSWGRAPAFSNKTKAYFQRRFVRHLSRAGESGRADLFIPMAVGVLMANDDEVQRPEEEQISEWIYDWEARSYDQRHRYSPRYSRHHTFLWLLRSAGSALTPTSRSLRWWYRSAEHRGFATSREEPFAHLWDQAPDAIIHLLRHARSEEVQRFAVRVWRANPHFVTHADAGLVRDLLRSWCEPSIELGLELARELWDPENPDVELLVAMLDAGLQEARTLGARWLGEVEKAVCGDPQFLSRLAFLHHADARERARELAKNVMLATELQKTLIGLVVSALIEMTDPDDESVRAHAADYLALIAPEQLAHLGLDHVGQLLAHRSEACQQLGARSLIQRPNPGELPDALLLAPLSSEYATVRRLGMKLLEGLKDDELAQREDLIVGFGTSKHREIREQVGPLVERLVASNPELGDELVESWYPLLLREESWEGLHADLYALLSGPLSHHLRVIPRDAFRRMLTLRYAHAQLLGFDLLDRVVELEDESIPTLVEWAGHELLVLRERVRGHFAQNPERLRRAPGQMMPMLESNWDDTQEWAFAFCREEVPEEAWSAEDLVTVCDSVKSRVQSFGREMITRRFRTEDGPLYLRRLSEHPTVDLQIFATNYLARFAAGDDEAIRGLDHYFRAVLSKIGAGRVAKTRVLAFLEEEALARPEAADYVEGLLRRQVATVSVTDKASCIRILASIRRRWPELPTMLERKSPDVYQPEPG